MLAKHGFGHVGGSLSIADAIAVLYAKQMKYDPTNPKWDGRDYLVLSKGHCGPALYAALAIEGFFPREELLTINHLGTRLPSHADKNLTPGIDMTTGSWPAYLRTSMAMPKLRKPNMVYAIIGVGEAQEGRFETMMIAPTRASKFHSKMDNNNSNWMGLRHISN